MIDKGADVNKSDAELNSLLNIACQYGHESIAELLIKHKADVNAANDFNSSPMSTCAITGNKTIADLLYCANCDLTLTNQRCETPLFVATKNRNLVMVEFLIHGNCRIGVGDENDSTEMIMAAKLGYTEILKFLMEHACATLNVCDKQGCTPLYHAVIEHQVDVVKELIGHKQINLDRPSTKGLTPLLVAITNNYTEIAHMLLDTGCDVDKRDRLQNAPIHAAVRQMSLVFGHEEESMLIVKKLVSLGCDINVEDIEKKTPLFLSAFVGNKELTELFLNMNADLTKYTTHGDTALHGACGSIKSHVDVVNMLVKAGCSLNDPNNNGEIPLFSAIFNRAHIKIIKDLVENGSNINHREKTQQLSPLHEAVIQHFTEAAIYLIDSGCDVNIPNKQLQQPLYTACEKGNEKVVQYLLDTRKCKIDGLIPSAIPLFVAIANNNLKIVEILTKAGCSLNKMNEKCLTPIMFAAEQNNLGVVRILLINGCDLNAQAKVTRVMKCCVLYPVDKHPHFELEPLFFAVTHKNKEMIDLMLNCYNVNQPYWVMELLIKFLKEIRELNRNMTPEQKKEIIILFLKASKIPRSLQQICRGSIREMVGSYPHGTLDKLTIATKLKDYILMRDLFIDEEVKEEEISEEEREMGRFN